MPQTTNLDGRKALVTGGGRGIGRAIAAAMAAAGARVTLLGRDEAALKEAVGSGHGHAYVVADVTDMQAVREAIHREAEKIGPFDLLVANAGAAESAPFHKADPGSFRRMFDVNVMGVVHAVQSLLPGMTARGAGRIVVIASTAGLKGYPYVSAYCTAKHAVVGLVRSLALEIAMSGVTINAVCPGFTDTDLVEKSISEIMAKTGKSREATLAAMLRGTPMGRLIKPEEVAAAVMFLCSADAAAMNGTILPVAGGEV